MSDALRFSDLMAIFQRRKLSFAVPALMLFVLSIVLAVMWPPSYRSTTTVLIDQPASAKDNPPQSANIAIEQQLQAVSERVTASDTLAAIVTRYALYPEIRAKKPISDVIDRMRGAIRLEQINTKALNKTRAPTLVGFTLSYDYVNPHIAQRVTTELIGRLVGENNIFEQQKTAQSTQFYNHQLEALEAKMHEQEAAIANYKAAHSGNMPDDLSFNMQQLAQIQSALGEVNRQLHVASERQTALQAQLATLPANNVASSPSGTVTMTPQAQLGTSETQLALAEAQYGPNHPDVLKLTKEVARLKAMLGGNGSNNAAAVQLDLARAKLTATEKQYGPAYPDLALQRKQIAALEAAAQSVATPLLTPDNPAYLSVKAMLDGAAAELQSLTLQRNNLQAQYDLYQHRVTDTPAIERDFVVLRRDYDNAMTLHKNLKEQAEQAELAETMEQSKRTQHLQIINPPTLPTRPILPMHTIIISLGIMMAIGGGLAGVAVGEAFDDRVWRARQISTILGAAPLVALPYIRSALERARQRLRLRLAAMSGLLLIIGLAYAAYALRHAEPSTKDADQAATQGNRIAQQYASNLILTSTVRHG